MIARKLPTGYSADMICRPGCGACCIEISISSPIPGMPNGKPGGVRCIHLNEENCCRIHMDPDYPPVCRSFNATREICGKSSEEAFHTLGEWEVLTKTDENRS